MKKKCLMATVVALLVVVLSGCSLINGLLGNFDAAKLVKGNLDSVYLGEHSDEFISMLSSGSEETLETEYRNGLKTEAEYFMNYFDIEETIVSEETKERIVDLYEDIYSHSKYEVGEAVKNDETYLISVTVYPMDIIEQALNDGDLDVFVNDFNTKASSGEFASISDEEYEEIWANGIISIIEGYKDSIGYLDPQTISVQVVKDTDGIYVIDSNDFARIDELMIAY